MKPVAYLLIVLFALLGMASAKDNAMVFYNANWDCQSKADHIGCGNLAPEACCSSHHPFCGIALLANMNTDARTIYFTVGSKCEINDDLHNYNRCIAHGVCCIPFPEGFHDDSSCSAYWHDGAPNPPSDAANSTQRACQDPNFLAYDDDGTQRKIFIPDGSFGDVMELYSQKDFDALRRFRDWDG